MLVRLNTLSFTEATKLLKAELKNGEVTAKVYNDDGYFTKHITILAFKNKHTGQHIEVTNSPNELWQWYNEKSWGYRNLEIYTKQYKDNSMQLVNILQLGDVNLRLTDDQYEILKNSSEGSTLLRNKKADTIKVIKALEVGDELLSISNLNIKLTEVPESD